VFPGFFSDAEIAPLREACHADPSIGGRLRAVADSSGNAQDIIEWTTFSDDYLGMLPRLPCMIAVDRVTRANGCVNLVPGSHRYGRIDHVRIGASSGCDPRRLELIQRKSPPVPVEAEPGDACFFHCNTLHASAGNSTDSPRTLLHCTYNAIDNSPFIGEGQEHHRYRPFDKIADGALREHRWKDVFKNHSFDCFGDAGAVNRYGYQVIAHA
jgi:hypothetical protein